MILDRPDPTTGLPLVKEDRMRRIWRALTKQRAEDATGLDELPEGTPWYPRHHEWDGKTLVRVRCWKCGRDLKGWRLMLDPHKVGFNKDGQPITYSEANIVKVAGKPAVAFLTLPHAASTPIAVRWPKLNKTVLFQAQHCMDCQIASEDLDRLVTCFLAGTDAILWNAWNHGSASTVTPDRWATYLYRWSNAEPISVANAEDVMSHERVPAPGELITAAQYILDVDTAQRSAVPSGAVMEFEGAEAPAGWMWHPTKEGRIVKL